MADQGNAGEPLEPERRFLLPPDVDWDDDADLGCGIPDDDGWIYLNRPADSKPRRDGSRPTP